METTETQSQQATNALEKKNQTHSVTMQPITPTRPPQTLMKIATSLEQAILKHNPMALLKAALEDAVKEIKKAAKKKRERAALAVSSLAKAIYDHIKVDLSTFYEALDSKLSDI